MQLRGLARRDPRLGAAMRRVEAFPGLTREPSDIGVRLILPQSLRSTHESHFGMVLNDFLDLLEAGTWSASLAAQIRARYTLIATAKSRAALGRQSPHLT